MAAIDPVILRSRNTNKQNSAWFGFGPLMRQITTMKKLPLLRPLLIFFLQTWLPVKRIQNFVESAGTGGGGNKPGRNKLLPGKIGR